MSTSPTEIRRKLRVAFTVQELEILQSHAQFERVLRECRGSQGEIRNLITLGGALLAELSREKSKLRNRNRGQ